MGKGARLYESTQHGGEERRENESNANRTKKKIEKRAQRLNQREKGGEIRKGLVAREKRKTRGGD